jgi:hypothetical protein
MFLAPRFNLGGKHLFVFSAGVPVSAEDSGITKSGREKFVQEGHAFFGTRYSSVPVGGRLLFGRQRFAQDHFGGK